MNSRLVFLVAAGVIALGLLLANAGDLSGAVRADPQAVGDQYGVRIVPDGEPLTPLLAPAAGETHLVQAGSMWRPENPKHFSINRPIMNVTELRLKANKPLDQWVHIGLPLATYIEGGARNIKYVEFCAQSTNGAATKPTRMDLWDDSSMFRTVNINWAANNNKQCASTTFTPTQWRASLNLVVRLHFANSTDRIMLYRAYVKVE